MQTAWTNSGLKDWKARQECSVCRSGTPSTILENYIQEGDKLHLGSEIFDIFQVPGHSPGSIILYNAKNNIVFVGDVLFHGGIGRSDWQGGNYQSLIEGIQDKLLTLPENTVVYSGHGPVHDNWPGKSKQSVFVKRPSTSSFHLQMSFFQEMTSVFFCSTLFDFDIMSFDFATNKPLCHHASILQKKTYIIDYLTHSHYSLPLFKKRHTF